MSDQGFIPGLGIPSALMYSALGVPVQQPMQSPGLGLATLGGADGPVSDPSQVPSEGPDNAPASPSFSGSVQGSIDQSRSAYNPATADAIDARGRRPGGINGTLQDIHNQQAAVLGQADTTAQTAADEAKKAQTDVGEAEQAKIEKQGQQNHSLSMMNQGYADEDAKQDAIVQTKLTQASTDYAAAMADFRAAKVNPGQLWSNMSGGEKFGMLAAAFAHDYLGSRGIHTSVMDTFNRAVEQNINAQVENIKNKREAAEGFKSLFDMATSQSRTESEAKLRMRGYLLTSFQDQVASEMAGYDSSLAGAKSQQAVAAIDGELAKNRADLAKIWNANANSERDAAMQKYGDDQRASMEIAKAKIEAGARAGAGASARQDKLNETQVKDPESGKILGHEVSSQAAEKTQTSLKDQYNTIKEGNEYLTQASALGKKYNGPLAGKFQSADAASIDALRDHLALSLEKAIGGVRTAASAQMAEKYQKFFPKDGITDVDGLRKMVGVASEILQTASAEMSTSRVTLRHEPEDEQFNATLPAGEIENEPRPIGPSASPAKSVSPGARTELNAFAATRGENPTDNLPVNEIVKQVQGESGTDRVSFGKDEAHAQEYLGYLNQHKDEIQSGDKGTKYDRIDLNDGQNHGGTEVPTWGDALMKLQDIATPNAKSPNPVIQGFPDQYTPEERKQAREMLVQFSRGGADNQEGANAMSADQILFAQYLLGDLVHRENGIQ